MKINQQNRYENWRLTDYKLILSPKYGLILKVKQKKSSTCVQPERSCRPGLCLR